MAQYKLTTFRLNTELVKRLDAHARRLTEATGIRCTRADALRILLTKGLDAAERNSGQK